jgi:hypothetical protein
MILILKEMLKKTKMTTLGRGHLKTQKENILQQMALI